MSKTLEVTSETTSQEIFNFVISHLHDQGERAEVGTGVCAYRGRNGTMCAVGCVIPDEFYDASMEGSSLEELIIARIHPQYEDYITEFIEPHADLLNFLQRFHDNTSVWHDQGGFSDEGLEELSHIASEEILVLPKFLETYSTPSS